MKKLSTFLFVSFFACMLSAADYSKFAQVKTISSDFVMEKHLELAAKPLISKGRFYFERPGFLRWEYTTPFISGVLLNGDKAYSWKQVGGKKHIKDVSNQPFAKIMAKQIYVFVSMDVAEISARYNIEEREKGLDLLPKNNSAGQTVERIKLFFNESLDAVTRVEMHDKNGEKTIISFTGTLLDRELPAEVKQP